VDNNYNSCNNYNDNSRIATALDGRIYRGRKTACQAIKVSSLYLLTRGLS